MAYSRWPFVVMIVAWLSNRLDALSSILPSMPDTRNRSLARANRAQGNLPGVIIMIGVSIVAGFTVLYLANEVISILNMSDGGPNSTADPLYDSFLSLQQATNSAFGLFGFLFILVIMAVGIGYLYRLTNQ